MKRISYATLLVALIVAAPGCATTTTTNAPTNAANANATPAANASASPSPTATPTTNAADGGEAELPLTLPVLDAMFADSSFAGALKSKLQLTTEQVESLRKIAREETAKLSEKEAGSGTTSAATRAAAEKIKGVVGEEKLAAFTAFVREHWSDGAGALPLKPN